MVGSALYRLLQKRDNVRLIVKTRRELDLLDQAAVRECFQKEKPDEVILAAAKVGGIYANNEFPADFIYNNLQIQNNVINASHKNNINKLLFLGSSCIYPKFSVQPISEDALLTGILENTNEPYAIAKIAGIKLCESFNRQYGRDYRSIMPTNLYGPGDNYDEKNGHVIPALIRRFHNAKVEKLPVVEVWGTGNPRREFLFVDDLAEACLFIHDLDVETYRNSIGTTLSHINIGTGQDISIAELGQLIKKVVGYRGEILFDQTKPDGTPRKQLNVELINSLGWHAKTKLTDGLTLTYREYQKSSL